MQTSEQDHLVGHLSDEQFTGLLLGTIPPAVGAHLKACGRCAEEAERVSGAIASFEQQSRVWAERRAGSRPPLTPDRQPAFAWLQIAGRPQMWVAASLAVALAVGVGAGIRTERRVSRQDKRAAGVTTAPQTAQVEEQAQAQAKPVAPVIAAATSAGPVTPVTVAPATLKSDNELLSAIDGELSAEAAPSASAYGLTGSDHSAGSRAAKRIAN